MTYMIHGYTVNYYVRDLSREELLRELHEVLGDKRFMDDFFTRLRRIRDGNLLNDGEDL